MAWFQKQITLRAKRRGFHLITQEVVSQVPELRQFTIGWMHVFIQHTSASLTLNENASPEVRADMEDYFNRHIPEEAPYFRHTYEGPDDMPAHIKASLLGSSLILPIQNGHLALGTWQGLYLGEHRDYGGPRRLVITIQGEHRS